MNRFKFKKILVLVSFLLTLHIANTAVISIKRNSDLQIESTTIKTQETSPLSELIQLQTDAIKKILSTSGIQSQPHTDLQKSTTNKCEDIESIQNTQNPDVKQNVVNTHDTKNIETITDNNSRGDVLIDTAHDHTQIHKPDPDLNQNHIQDKTTLPTGRTLFNLYPQQKNQNNQELVTPDYKNLESHNVILIPCLKRIFHNHNGTRRISDDHKDHASSNVPEQFIDQQIETISPQSLVLEKVYSADGQFMYYMYRLRNLNYENHELSNEITSTLSSSTTSATTTTTTTTNNPVSEPTYTEQMKFVLQMPYAEPEPPASYPNYFDQYAYYPKEMQPTYINAPVPYKPVYHMIRTLVVPHEYNSGRFIMVTPQDGSNENTNN